MPEKFPLEYFYRTHHPDAWYEFWQDSDFDLDPGSSVHTPEGCQDAEDYNWSPFGWSEPYFFEP